jgi:hypothetical protein
MDHRRRHWCPFLAQLCTKQSRNLTMPFGVCSVHYGGNVVAICPNRFLQANRIFTDIAVAHFDGTHDLLIFPEVRISVKSRTGRRIPYAFDYVIVKHAPLSIQIQDFVLVEFQTVDTTNTGKLVEAFQAFMNEEDIQGRRYGFGMNWKNVWKRCFTQMLQKGILAEAWGQKIYWIAQEASYQHLRDSYGLYDMDFDSAEATIFSSYKLIKQDDGYVPQLVRQESSSVHNLFMAFEHNTPVPSRATFMQRLEERVSDSSTHLNLNLDSD